MPDEEFSQERRLSHRARDEVTERWRCASCGHGVYPSRHYRSKLRHYRHFPGAPESCPWHHGDGYDLDEIDRLRFGGIGEGELHETLKLFLMAMTNDDPRFAPPPDIKNFHPFKEHRIPGVGRKYRRPDVYRSFRGNRLAFEVQLASTHLKVIDGREQFYRRKGIWLAWVFWNFPEVAERLSASDIFNLNRSNALLLDMEVIDLSRETGRLHLRAWWWEQTGDGRHDREWQSEIIDFDQLEWDPESCLPFYRDPTTAWKAAKAAQAEQQAAVELDELREFRATVERYWAAELGSDDDEEYDLGQRKSRWAERGQAYVELASRAGCKADWKVASKLKLHTILPRLYAIRDGRGSGKMSLVETIMLLLQQQRHVTHVVVAIARAYGRQAELDKREKAREKVLRNVRDAVEGDEHSVPARDIDPIFALLFPEAADAINQEWPPVKTVEFLTRRGDLSPY